MNNNLNINDHDQLPLYFTDLAANKVKELIMQQININKKFRVYITGGGCSGFQYNFTLIENMNPDDYLIEKNGASLVVDPISLQYLMGGTIDYNENIKGSSFIIINPNAKTTCGCGSSFNI